METYAATLQVTNCTEQRQLDDLTTKLRHIQENLIDQSAKGSIDVDSATQESIKKIVQSKSADNMLESKAEVLPLQRKKSADLLPVRNIRHEQLTQLIAGKIREGEMLLTSSAKDEWQSKASEPTWKFCLKTKGVMHSVLNEIRVDIPYDLLKEKIIRRGKSSRSLVARSEVAEISKVCSINHEKISCDGVDSQDYVLLTLEKEFRDGFFKIAEMSIEEKHCPPLSGCSREQIDLRYYQASPDKEDPKCSKLWVVHSFKLKPQRDSSQDIENIVKKSDLFVENMLRELRA